MPKKYERVYRIREVPGFQAAYGEWQPKAFVVELQLTEIATRTVTMHQIGQHRTYARAQAHIEFHKARLMPLEGGEFEPYEYAE